MNKNGQDIVFLDTRSRSIQNENNLSSERLCMALKKIMFIYFFIFCPLQQQSDFSIKLRRGMAYLKIYTELSTVFVD